jgi:RimJ/RimL family protein N-acetyltransferase
MSWIEFEPLSDPDRIALIRRWENDWKAGQEVVFGAFEGDQVVGGCGFHRRAGPQTLEIGYWVHVDHLRQGYATEMTRMLTSAAFIVPGIERVEIHHDKANTRSRAIPEALGYHLEGESQVKPLAPATIGIDVAWSMNENEWRGTIGNPPQHPMKFFIRKAVEADIPRIRECYTRSWRAAYAESLAPDVLKDAARKRQGFDWARGIQSPSSVVRVAVDSSDRMVGVMQADEDPPPPRDIPEIEMLYVDPAVWGSSVAVRLLDTGLGWIADRGHDAARLRVVEKHHRPRRFYEREGWKVDPDLEPARNEFFRLIYYRREL